MADSQRQMDWNGFMEVRSNPISKVGVFPYLGEEIPGAPEPDKIYYVYRPAEELARQETIDSFKLMPFIDEHEVLGVGGMPAERKGMQGVIGEQVYFDPPYLRGNLKIHSNAAQSLIKAGKVELSPCYGCDWVAESGEFEGKPYQYVQRNIMGNHLALVKEGRTGPDVAVLDHRKFTLDSKELLPMALAPEDMEAIKTMVLELLAAQKNPGDEDPVAKEEPKPMDEDPDAASDEDKPTDEDPLVAAENYAEGDEERAEEKVEEAIEEVEEAAKELAKASDSKRPAATARLNRANKALKMAKDSRKQVLARKKAAKDSAGVLKELASLRKQLAELKAPAKGSASFLGQIADRDQLYHRVSQFTGAFDHARMDAAAIAVYACDKLSIKCQKGTESVALDAWLQGRKPEQPSLATDSAARGGAFAEWSKK